jgi:hypothetical protein
LDGGGLIGIAEEKREDSADKLAADGDRVRRFGWWPRDEILADEDGLVASGVVPGNVEALEFCAGQARHVVGVECGRAVVAERVEVDGGEFRVGKLGWHKVPLMRFKVLLIDLLRGGPAVFLAGAPRPLGGDGIGVAEIRGA